MSQDQISMTLTVIVALTGVVTAIATFFLWRVTNTLAVETKRMAEATAQPHVVATLAPNRWAINHMDLHVDNTGNAAAYDISVKFDPPLENSDVRANKGVPFERISVLKPGQNQQSYLCAFEKIHAQSYEVTVTWKRRFGDSAVETNRYTLDMAGHKDVSRLGQEPIVQLADSLKKMQEDLRGLARGTKRLQIDQFDQSDRDQERARIRERYAQIEAEEALEKAEGEQGRTSTDSSPEA
ncbi:hypothetical protein [Xanthomonas campestris]|uniref:hypothetical protein n=1 Tax=Xanthomonas campestris TaxID=339 RepID=UPI0023791704|nr:hypothetical protein [Xanthomonas campestris]WDL55832.1 hypothetical protein JH263_07645 [Xanthomonas campestris pv. campestris]